ncbi:hypothetical protein DRF02_05770 [Salmonella enterica subsp. salamae]|nr:hypothetical protein [Salmonella enterica subsp. salamae]
MIITGSPGIIWTKAKVRRVIPINVGITSPKRRRMNCNITRILSHDARPGTVSLYCSQILSRSKTQKTAEGRSIVAGWRYAYPANRGRGVALF